MPIAHDVDIRSKYVSTSLYFIIIYQPCVGRILMGNWRERVENTVSDLFDDFRATNERPRTTTQYSRLRPIRSRVVYEYDILYVNVHPPRADDHGPRHKPLLRSC